MNRERTILPVLAMGALLMAGCAPGSAGAEPQGRTLAVDQAAGVWTLTGPEGARCRLSLSNMLIDGVRPVLAERCGVPAAADARSWRTTANGFELLAADGEVLLAFRRTGEDAFASITGGYRLSRAAL